MGLEAFNVNINILCITKRGEHFVRSHFSILSVESEEFVCTLGRFCPPASLSTPCKIRLSDAR